MTKTRCPKCESKVYLQEDFDPHADVLHQYLWCDECKQTYDLTLAP
jgi:uncharacterized protein YbaR (Trm112 family)